MFDPDTCCGHRDGGEEVSGELVISGGDGSEVFEFVEEALDEVALAAISPTDTTVFGAFLP